MNNLITPRALSSLHSRKAALYFIKVDRITHSRLQTPVLGLYSFEIIQDDAWPPLGFGLTESRSIRTADSENPTLEPKMKCIGWPFAEISPFEIFEMRVRSSVGRQNTYSLLTRILYYPLRYVNKKAVLPQGNRAMLQVSFSVEVRQQHSLQV